MTTDCICVTTGNGSEGCGLCNETGSRMTQAPTPGPLSGDAMRAEYARVEQIREQAETHERSARATNDLQAKSDHETQAAMAWDRYDRELAKFNATAPVEASGSERERLIEVVLSFPETVDLPTQRAEDLANEVLAALRPQPSGETREAVAHEIYDYLNERFPDGPMPGGVQLFDDPGDHTDAAMKHEAGCDELAGRILTLIRPAPVASGGQHSSGEVDKVEMIADLIEKYTYVMSKHNPDMARVAGHNSCAQHILAALTPVAETAGEALTVWYGSMPESNGRQNWTAVLGRKDATGFDFHTDGFCFARSEYPGRVLYDADHMRWVIGELAERPCVLDYDEKSHSGYVAPVPAQDDDKLRMIGSAFDRMVAETNRCGRWSIATDTLAALKSTAAQEGGE